MTRAFLPPAFIGVGERGEIDRRPILQQLTKQEPIAGIMVDYYTELLDKKQNQRTRAFTSFLMNGKRLRVEEQLELIRPYTQRDVK